MTGNLLALVLTLLVFPQQPAGPSHAFPRPGAKQVIDNEHVTVWDVVWEKGKSIPTYRLKYDSVVIDLAEATMSVSSPQGARMNVISRPGQTTFFQKGTTRAEEGTSSAPRHAIVVDLKDVKVPALPNKTGHADAFPRDGAKRLMDNGRVVVWDYSWTAGKPTAMHFHDKDVVVVYLGNGDLSSTTPDGKTTVNSYSFGQTKFNARDRTHSELLVKGSQRVIAVELK